MTQKKLPKGQTKFVRIRGRIVPIKARKDKGLDLRTNRARKKVKTIDIIDVYKKHGRDSTTKERFKGAGAGFLAGSMLGGMMGVPVDMLRKGKFGKATLIGAGAIGALSALVGGSKSKTMSKEKYNKIMGKKLAKRSSSA